MSLEIYEDQVYGQVLPLKWDKDFVCGVVILVDGEEEYIVDTDKNGLELVEYVDRWITADGLIRETSKDIRIRVNNFTVEDNWEYQDDDNW